MYNRKGVRHRHWQNGTAVSGTEEGTLGGIMISPYLDWMDREARDMLENCFDWTEETLPPGAAVQTAGRVGWLLSGEGLFDPSDPADPAEAAGSKIVSQGGVIGVKRAANGDREREDGTVTAKALCEIAWFDYDLLRFSCYRGCWFHARVMREVEEALG